MARGSFGGGADDYVENSVGTRLPGAIATMWSAQTGGTQYTDLLLGATATTTVTAGTRGALPVFSGPDGIIELWVDGGGGQRSRLFAFTGALTLTAGDLRYRQPGTDNAVYVSSAATSSDTNDGLSWSSAFVTIGRAITAIGVSSGTINLGRGDYTIAAADASGNGATLKNPGQHIVGRGRGTTRVIVNVAATWGIKLEAKECSLRRLTLQVAATRTVTYATGVGTLASPGSAQNCQFEDVHVNVAGTVNACFALGPDFPGASNIDIAQTEFHHCSYDGVSLNINTGWVSGNGTSGNVTANAAYACGAVGGNAGLTLQGSGFQWIGGGMASVRTADVYISQGHPDPFVMLGARSENGGQAFLTSYGGGHGGVLLTNCSFDRYASASNRIVEHNMAGPLTIIGGVYSNTNGISKIAVNTSASAIARSLIAIGVHSNDADPYPAAGAFITRTILGAQKLVAGNVEPNTAYTFVVDNAAIRLARGATAARPTPAVAGAGGTFYDTTLIKPIFSDGTAWRDAAGTAV